MAPFYGWGSTASRLEPLQGGSLLFTTKKLMYLPCVDNPSGANKEGRPSLDSLLIKKVTQFYERDDSSRISPGKRDTVTVVTNWRKEAVQKRHLYVTLDELYQLFMEEYPYVSISCLKFASLQPSHVLLNSQMLNRVCLCHYHENFIMLLEALCKVHIEMPIYSSQFVKSLVCAQPTEHCWNNVCDECKDVRLFYYTSYVSINWFQWKNECELTTKINFRS